MMIADEIRKDPAATGAFLMETDIQIYVGYLNLPPSSKVTATTLLVDLFEKKKKKLPPVNLGASMEPSVLIHVGEDIVTHILSKDRTQRIAGLYHQLVT
jgi:hypothetical protein